MTKLNLKQTNLLEILIALNAWELEEKTELQTQSGRSLYFQLAQAMLASESAGGVSLKRRVGTACERSIRERIRTFQQAELLCVKGNDKDAISAKTEALAAASGKLAERAYEIGRAHV